MGANSAEEAEVSVEAKKEKEDAASGSEADAFADEKSDEPVEVEAEEPLVVEDPKIESPELTDSDSELGAREDASSGEEETEASGS